MELQRLRGYLEYFLRLPLPHADLVDRNDKKVTDLSRDSNPPRVFVSITKEDAEQLEFQYGCQFFCVDRNWIYYDIPEDMSELLPVLEFAYRKHSGN